MNRGNIMRKLLRQPASNESADANISDSPQLRPSASQNTIYSAGAPILCLDQSPDGQHAVIGSSKVFKTIRISGSTINEEIDLRTIISSYATTHDTSSATAEQLSIKAVIWSHSILDTTIITACANGRITVYDLNRLGEGLEVARIQEHARQVHKLAINPFRCNWLLSASQDGTIKSFDIRAPIQGRNGPTFRTWQTFKCNANAVRDVKWSPVDGLEFACATDAGVVQKWDIRKPSAPVLKFTAHQNACFSIAWHPDGEHLISGGMDQHCHVWDVSKKAERNQKAKYSFLTPAPVSIVSWRPACWSSTAQGKRAAQVTVVYDDSNPSKTQNATVHLWDLARSSMPYKEIEHWDSSPTGLLWSTRDLLWSVDKDGHFTQTDVAFVPKVIDRRSVSTFSFSSGGDVLMLLEERQPQLRPRPTISSAEVPQSYNQSSSGPSLSVSRSDSEDDVVGSFLGSRKMKNYRRRHDERSTQSQALSTTPPTIPSIAESKVMSLDDAVKVTGTYKPQQIMAIGHAPSTAKRSIYLYLTNKYLVRIDETRSAPYELQRTDTLLALTMEHFARTAENVSHYRLAQTWRLLGYIMNLLLQRRAEYHRQVRLKPQKEPSKQELKELKPLPDAGEETPRKLPRDNPLLNGPGLPATISMIAEDIESTSNVTTPLVRPVRDNIVEQMVQAIQTPIPVENDVINLPPPSHSASPSPIPVPRASQSSGQEPSSIEGYDFYGIESVPPIINFTVPRRKAPLRLDYPDYNISQRMQVARHNSGDSFQMFSTSADSHSAKFMSSSDSDSQSMTKESDQSLRDAVSSWENGVASHPSHRSSIDSGPSGQAGSSDAPFTPNSTHVNPGAEKEIYTRQASLPTLHVEEATLPIAEIESLKEPKDNSSASPPLSEITSDDPNIIESDFFPRSNDPEFVPSPIDPNVLIQRTIEFETQTGSLNASAIVLLLGPLLPPKALDKIQCTAILRQYHHRLMSMRLFTEAALLRNLCVPLYPRVFAPGQQEVNTGFFCTDCQKPLENDPLIPSSIWRCPRCRQAIDGCAVCRHRDADGELNYDGEEIVGGSLIWWYCPGCGHGGHSACMQAWHAGAEYNEGSKHSGGSCPLEGCLHPCIPGTWREQRAAERRMAKAKELDKLVKESSARQGSGRGSRGASVSVRRDAREVTQSKAVEGVRVALALSQSGGLERKKSVKVVAPGEQS